VEALQRSERQPLFPFIGQLLEGHIVTMPERPPRGKLILNRLAHGVNRTPVQINKNEG
jgi:hypothetical protein